MLRTTLGTVLVACLLAAPASEAATTRYVGNPGTGGAPCTDEQHPCVLFTALNAAVAGDTVQLRRDPNPYNLTGALTIDKRLNIVGAPGQRPVFQFTASSGGGFVFGAGSAGSELRHLRIETPNGATGVNVQQRAALADLDLSGAGPCVRITAPDSALTDSSLTTFANSETCLASGAAATGLAVRSLTVANNGPFGTGVDLDGAGLDATDLNVTAHGIGLQVSGGASAGDAQATLRRARVTTETNVALRVMRDEGGGALVVSDVAATASGAPSTGAQTWGAPTLRNISATASGGVNTYGLYVISQVSNPPAALVVRNSVFRGDYKDAFVDDDHPATGPPAPSPARYRTPTTITHSNFVSLQGTLTAGSGNNQSGDPLFANAAAGDLHPLAGSPLIDAGTADPANGTTDVDGRARSLGAAPDIGAYEFPPPAPSPPGGTGDPGSPGAPGGAVLTADLAAPELTGLALTNRTFAVGPASTPVAARAKRGTTFRLTVNEKATITIGFEHSEAGRRKGRRCVKPTKKNRKARRCRRWVPRGSIQRAAGPGPVAIPFSGRIGRKALKTGSYRALVAARDAAGNLSKQRTVPFKVVRR